MNKKRAGIFICFILIVFMLSFVSAGFFSDLWAKITGKTTYSDCTDSDGGSDYYTKGTVSFYYGATLYAADDYCYVYNL